MFGWFKGADKPNQLQNSTKNVKIQQDNVQKLQRITNEMKQLQTKCESKDQEIQQMKNQLKQLKIKLKKVQDQNSLNSQKISKENKELQAKCTLKYQEMQAITKQLKKKQQQMAQQSKRYKKQLINQYENKLQKKLKEQYERQQKQFNIYYSTKTEQLEKQIEERYKRKLTELEKTLQQKQLIIYQISCKQSLSQNRLNKQIQEQNKLINQLNQQISELNILIKQTKQVNEQLSKQAKSYQQILDMPLINESSSATSTIKDHQNQLRDLNQIIYQNNNKIKELESIKVKYQTQAGQVKKDSHRVIQGLLGCINQKDQKIINLTKFNQQICAQIFQIKRQRQQLWNLNQQLIVKLTSSMNLDQFQTVTQREKPSVSSQEFEPTTQKEYDQFFDEQLNLNLMNSINYKANTQKKSFDTVEIEN